MKATDLVESVYEHVVATSTKKRPATITKYRRAIRAFLAFAGSHGLPFNGATVEAWRDAKVAEDVPAGTINGKLAALKFAGRRYEDLGYGVNFARGVEFLTTTVEKKREARPVVEAMRLLAACRGGAPADLRDCAMFTLGFRTGLRRESLVLLRFEDMEGRRFSVVIKGGRLHRLDVDDDVLLAMRPWVDWLGRHGVKTGYIFRSLRPSIGRSGIEIGEGLHPTSINRIMAEDARRPASGSIRT